MKETALNKLIATSFAWNLTGNLISKGSTFLVSILAARMLGVVEFGKIGLIQQTLAVFLILSVMGLSVTAIKYTASSRLNGRSAVNSVINRVSATTTFLSVTMGGILFLASEKVSIETVGTSELTNIFKICSIVLLISSLNQVQFGILSGLGDFRKIAISNTISGITNIPITVSLIYLYETNGFVISLATSGAITLISNKVFINKAINKLDDKPNIQPPSISELANFSIPNLLAGILFSASSWLSIVILTREAGLENVSAFNAASQIFGIIYIFPTMLAQVVMSLSASRPDQKSSVLKKSLIATAFFTLAMCIPVYFLAEILMGMYSSELQDHSMVLIALLPSLVVLGISNQIDHFAVGQGWTKEHLYLTGIFSVALVAFSILLSQHGALGIAISKLIAHSIKLIISIPLYISKNAKT